MMILLREIIITVLLAITGWLLALVAKLRFIQERALGAIVRPQIEDEHVTVSEHSQPSIAGRVLLASLVSMSIALTWLWFVVRAMG